MLSLQDFINTYKGRTDVGDTPENTGQCVGLIEVWTDNLGLPHTWGNAKDLPANAAPSYFDVINNDPNDLNQFPLPGDVICWNANWGGGVGHTAIIVTANGNSFTSFEQNDATSADPNGACEVLTHSDYSNVIGWLHPKVTIPTGSLNTYGIDPTNTASVQVVYDTWHDVSQGKYVNKSDYDAKVKSLQDTIDNLNGITKDKDQQIASVQTQVSSLESQVTSLTQAKETAEEIAKQVPTLQSDLRQAQNDRSTCLAAQEGQNKKIATLQQMVDAKKPINFIDKLIYLFT